MTTTDEPGGPSEESVLERLRRRAAEAAAARGAAQGASAPEASASEPTAPEIPTPEAPTPDAPTPDAPTPEAPTSGTSPGDAAVADPASVTEPLNRPALPVEPAESTVDEPAGAAVSAAAWTRPPTAPAATPSYAALPPLPDAEAHVPAGREPAAEASPAEVDAVVDERAPRGRRPRVLVLTSVVLLLVTLAGAFLAARWQRRVSDRDALASARSEVAVAAAQVALDFNTLDYTKPDDWQSRLQSVTTGGLRDDIAKQRATLFSIVVSNQTLITATPVNATASITNPQRTAAEALVQLTSNTKDKDHQAGVKQPAAYVIRLTKVGPSWLATCVNPLQDANVTAGEQC